VASKIKLITNEQAAQKENETTNIEGNFDEETQKALN
jgi:hypothetical protein